VRVRRYWRLKEEKRRLPYRTREEYYEAFREVFSRAVGDAVRTNHSVLSQISGGLDSSSVTAMAAKLLAGGNRRLHAFTAIPHDLEGPSRKRGWMYHELPLVRTVLDQHPNIDHHVFRTVPDADPVAEISSVLPLADQPACNVMNQHWFHASCRQAMDVKSRLILLGDGGNATISWRGITPFGYLRACRRLIGFWLRPDRSPSEPY